MTVALPSAYGKPWPALVIQSDLFDEHPSVTIPPVTSEVRDTPLFRIDVAPSASNGLRKRSQVMAGDVGGSRSCACSTTPDAGQAIAERLRCRARRPHHVESGRIDGVW